MNEKIQEETEYLNLLIRFAHQGRVVVNRAHLSVTLSSDSVFLVLCLT